MHIPPSCISVPIYTHRKSKKKAKTATPFAFIIVWDVCTKKNNVQTTVFRFPFGASGHVGCCGTFVVVLAVAYTVLQVRVRYTI